ncbi:RimJ/RimL family protein N-acetyltransferase [Pullulanibacillus pueri]|uniref:N-acetyltransferase n=1 Tax=Pullulanibacillus pueri TaxID=1437324 RepID=A0A8J2ZZB2_9BACL|nr:GNAT family protein [Pullulanibacillus pueri]MBM7683370.1 RimJ/RimL family protein N-acetyltransferase [Pullulanibacillus pueri]GGH86575.1 N-acetyltransferase [Pullulanibacillus pueri]
MKTDKLQSETERLALRLLQNHDYESYIEGYQNCLPKQHKYDDDKIDLSEWTQAKFNGIVTKLHNLADQDRAYVFAVFRKSDGKHIGKVEISTIMRDEFQWGLLGYRMHNQHWRRGYGKEAVGETLNIAFDLLNFHRIEAHINVDNFPSIHLVESIGMELECTRKKFIYEFGEWTDNLVYYLNSGCREASSKRKI